MKGYDICSLGTLLALTVLQPSCEVIDSVGEPVAVEEEEEQSRPTLVVVDSECGMLGCDVLIYEDGGLRRLETAARLEAGRDSLSLALSEGEKLIVGLANSVSAFNYEALNAYDTVELLKFYYQDEDPGYRLMSASVVCHSGDTVHLAMRSPLCCVQLRSVQHEFPDYKRMEDPVLFLEDANSYVGALERDGFLPEEYTSDTIGLRHLMWDRLPSDVGMYPQYPGTCLYCYPNGSGITHTKLVVEAFVAGQGICRFTTDLPCTSYGEGLTVDLFVGETAEDYRFSIESMRSTRRIWQSIPYRHRTGGEDNSRWENVSCHAQVRSP